MDIANPKNIKIIIGLGNPNKEFGKTRHNAGVLFIDYLLSVYGLKITNYTLRQLADRLIGPLGHRAKIGFLHEASFTNYKNFAYAKINNLVLAKTLTFMNESGKAVKEIMKYFSAKNRKIKPDEILVVRDDSDINFGGYKLKFQSGCGGHKGCESIISYLKTKNWRQLKIGVRPLKTGGLRPKANLPVEALRAKAEEFVLKNFSKNELNQLEKIFKEIIEKYNIPVL